VVPLVAPARKPPARQQDDDDPTPGQETFSHDYVRELRAENKGYRLKMTEERQGREAAERERDDARRAAEAAKAAADTEAQAKAKEAETKAHERIIRSELRTLAIKAGMVDLDRLKLADLSTVRLGEGHQRPRHGAACATLRRQAEEGEGDDQRGIRRGEARRSSLRDNGG
jgi:hypothetical protein